MKLSNLIALAIHSRPKRIDRTPEFLPLLPKQREIQKALSYDRLREVERRAPGAYTQLVRR